MSTQSQFERSSARLFISNLHSWVTESELREAFGHFGKLTDVQLLKKGGKARGFGFVGFGSPAAAQSAIDSSKGIDGIHIGAAKVRVAWAKSKTSSKAKAKRGEKIESPKKSDESAEIPIETESKSKKPKAKKDTDKNGVFIRNIPFEVEESGLLEWVRTQLQRLATDSDIDTSVESAEISMDSLGKSKGFASVRLRDERAAELLVSSCDTEGSLEMLGRRVWVSALTTGRRMENVWKDALNSDTLSYRQLRALRKRWRLSNSESLAHDSAKVWNPLSVALQTAVSETSAATGVGTDSVVLGSTHASVGMALAETGVLQHCAEWLRSEGVDVDWRDSGADSVVRSRTKIVVKHIPAILASDRLRVLFAKYGALNSAKFAPKSKAVALVEFTDARNATKAFKALSFYKAKPQSAPIYLEWAPLCLPRAAKRGLSGMQQSDETQAEKKETRTKLCIKNVAFEATAKEIRALFGTFGKVASVRIPTTASGTQHRGFAFVEFDSATEAKNAMAALKHSHFYGRKLVCQWAKT